MYKKILGPMDGSKLGECTLSHIKAVASGCNVPEVVLLTVLEPLQLPPFVTGRENSEKLKIQRETDEKHVQGKANEYLNGQAKKLKSAGVSVDTAVMQAQYNAADSILEFIKEKGIDLVVMSTHGRSGVTRWAFGSVADKVMRSAQVPVLMVTPKECMV
jgi:nucleotide-binding universal stress UspA family protein